MHISFADCFVDPATHEPLELVISERQGDVVESGYFKSSSNSYPIVRGIPRFVDFKSDNYSSSFGYQWQKWPRVQFESENVGKPMEGHTRSLWERITACDDYGIDVHGKLLVDMGCGPGRYVDVARSRGARVIGLDYSNAVEVAEENFKGDDDVCICQADAMTLPLREGSVDGIFSMGVLHHTPSPETGVLEAGKALCSGGWLAVSVYRKGRYYDFGMVTFWRSLFKFLWRFFGHYPPLVYTYFVIYTLWPIARISSFLGKAVRVFFPFVNLPDRDWALLDTFDSVTPSYQSTHETYEIFTWFKRAGFTKIEPTRGNNSFRGVKP